MSGLPRLRLHVTPAAEDAVRRGHPWVYADRIREQNRSGSTGELAVLYDRRDRFLALGLYDPDSALRVRVLHTGEPVIVNAPWWRARLEASLDQRAVRFGPATTGWRCVHGENDGWPGLVLDRFGEVFVLKLYTGAWLPRLGELTPILQDVLRPISLVLRLSRNIADFALRGFGLTDGTTMVGEAVTGPVVFLENGLRFEADPVRGQKTGFFLDQRENRERVEALAAAADVLNAFSFSGAFSLYAARGGARSVIDLDLSSHALAGAKRNFALNLSSTVIAGALHETIQADAFDWLSQDVRRQFDLVILDPPSLARREADRAGALAAYGRLARLGAVRVRAQGILLAASCSAHVPVEDFRAAVLDGIRRAGRTGEVLAATGHPVDHPARFPEAHYLKAFYVRLR